MNARALAALCLVAGMGSACATRGMDMPLGLRLGAEVYLAYGKVAGALFPSSPEGPEGFESSVFADLGDVTAVGLDVDARGDVFVAYSNRQSGGVSDNRFKMYWLLDDLAAQHVDDRRRYIESWAARGKDPLSWYTEREDGVFRLRDADADGVAEQQSTLATAQDVVTGLGSAVLASGDDVYWTVIPDLVRLRDGDDDGVAEVQEALSHGYGVSTSLVGHDLHGLVEGPDGRIYYSLGDRGYNVKTREGKVLRPPMVVTRGAVFRMWPDGSGLEVFATGLRNPQDLVFDDFGNLFSGDNNGDGEDEARLVHVMEGGDSGWAMPIQSMESEGYFHGPWEAEGLWKTPHAGQPAWLLPPIGHIDRGPAGATMDPGLGGLPDAFRGLILISDYQYVAARSGVRGYRVEPQGAGFVLAERREFIGGVLPTDLVFGPDGRIYLSEFDQFQQKSRIYRIENAEHVADPRVVALAELLRAGFAGRSDDELAGSLGHVDRRARAGAQRELAKRAAAGVFAGVARDRAAPLLARVHAMWGLGQLGAEALRQAGIDELAWTRDADPQLRVQALRLVGEARAARLADELVYALAHDPPHAQVAAAIALGKVAAQSRIGTRAAVAALVEVLRRNGESAAPDVYLRHAAVYGIALAADLDSALAHAADASAAVRMGVLLVLRRAEDPRIARFLHDAEPALVVEAARAIHDLSIGGALPALAALANEELPLHQGDDRQTSYALHRRVIGANLALGGKQNADALAAYLAQPANPAAMRAEALESLGEFAQPGPRERVFGFYRGWPERPESFVHAAIDRAIPALLGSELEARGIEIALQYKRVPLPDEDLLERVEGRRTPERVRVASLRVLSERRSPLAERATTAALASRHPALRAEARDALGRLRPTDALSSVRALSPRAPLLERQRAFATLASLANPSADAVLRAELERLRSGALDPAVALDLVEAVERRGAPLAGDLAAYESALEPGDVVSERQIALLGGDAARGRRIFEGRGDCQRCHSSGGGHGGVAGPDLDGVRKRGRAYLLESVLVPQAVVTPGFGSVGLVLANGETLAGTLLAENDRELRLDVGGDERRVSRSEIASSTPPSSAMPPMGLALSKRELRDLIEYLSTL